MNKVDQNPCIDILVSKLENNHYQLQVLYLNKCDLEDADGVMIANALTPNMRKLYMNNNHFTKVTAIKLAEMIEFPDIKLKELGLKWNQINGEGGCRIAEALSQDKDKELKILDLSWNKIGVYKQDFKPKHIGETWGKALIENKSLVHLDLSFNKICEEDTRVILEDIKSNQTLFGFHYQGNVSSGKTEK